MNIDKTKNPLFTDEYYSIFAVSVGKEFLHLVPSNRRVGHAGIFSFRGEVKFHEYLSTGAKSNLTIHVLVDGVEDTLEQWGSIIPEREKRLATANFGRVVEVAGQEYYTYNLAIGPLHSGSIQLGQRRCNLFQNPNAKTNKDTIFIKFELCNMPNNRFAVRTGLYTLGGFLMYI